MGMDSQETIDALEADVLASGYELAINVGDSSYADDYPSGNSWVEDKWYNAMQGIMANAPTAVVVGNHEAVSRGERLGSKSVYRNPGAPIYIVNGAAGNREGNEPTWLPEWLVKWRASHSAHFHIGYGRI